MKILKGFLEKRAFLKTMLLLPIFIVAISWLLGYKFSHPDLKMTLGQFEAPKGIQGYVQYTAPEISDLSVVLSYRTVIKETINITLLKFQPF